MKHLAENTSFWSRPVAAVFIAAALGDDDSIELHFQDTCAAGNGLCEKQVARSILSEAPQCISELLEWGAELDKVGSRVALTREGGHSRARIVHGRGDATGREVAETLNGLVAGGKVGWVGLSNAGIQHCQALAQCVPLRCNQIELSLQAQHWVWDGSLHALQAAGLQVLAWSPMGGGRFGERLCSALDEVAADLGATANQVALAWLRQLPGRPLPILGSLRWERIEEALLGAELELERPAWFYLSEAARGPEVA